MPSKLSIFGCGFNGFLQLYGLQNVHLDEWTVPVSKEILDDYRSMNSDRGTIVPLPMPLLMLNPDVVLKDIIFSWSNIAVALEKGGSNKSVLSGYSTPQDKLVAVVNSKVLCATDTEIYLQSTTPESNFQILQVGKFSTPQPLTIQEEQANFSSTRLYSCQREVFYTKGATEFGKLSAERTSRANPVVKLSHMEASIKIAMVSCGKEHVLILSQFGTLYSCGLGSRGQLGHGDVESETTPRMLEAMEGVRIQTCSAGGWHSACVTESGDAYSWGWDESGQLGHGSNQGGLITEPMCVSLPEDVNVKSVACGSRHTLLLTDQGQVLSTGWNAYGQLGLGHTINQDVFVNLNEIGSKCTEIFAGHWCSVFVLGDVV